MKKTIFLIVMIAIVVMMMVSLNQVEGKSSSVSENLSDKLQFVNNMMSQWSSATVSSIIPSEQEYQASIGHLIKKSKEMYSAEMRADFSSKLALDSIKRKTLDSNMVAGSWYLGDLTTYITKSGGATGCDIKSYPFMQMTSTGTAVQVSVVGINILKIDTIVQRPFSTLYNGILTYQKDSVPVCLDLKNGALTLSSDFLLCGSVDTKPTCSSVLEAVTITYNNPGTITSASIAGVVIIIVLLLICCIATCVCCCYCMSRRRRRRNRMAANNMNETLLVSHSVPNSSTTSTSVRY